MNRIFFYALLWLLPAASLFARGAIAPPRPYAGLGNAGDWLGSGPIVGFDHPHGDGIGGSGGGGCSNCDWGGIGNTGFTWDPDGDGDGGIHNPAPGGCGGTCYKPTWTGPCYAVCECIVVIPHQHAVDGEPALGDCEETGGSDTSCANAGDNCEGYVCWPQWGVR